MQNFRHPIALNLALVLVTIATLAGFARRASANGGLREPDYGELWSWPATPEEIRLPHFVGTAYDGKKPKP